MSVHKDKNSGIWYVHACYRDWQGDKKRKVKRGFKTKREAVEWEREFQLQRADDLSMSFSQFVEVYAEDRRPRLKHSTWVSKEYMINHKLIPFFGNMSMNEIDPKTIIRWQNQLIESKSKHGKPYSQTYLKSVHNQLTAILTHAFKYYGLKSNPASKVGSIGKKHANEMKFWTREEYEQFSQVAMEEPRFYYPFQILYWCGLRVGELLALTYKDIDFEKMTVTISKTYQVLKGKVYITEPKTPKSKRVVLMPEFLRDELRDYAALQYGHRETDRIFHVSKSSLNYHLKSNADKAGIKRIRVHDLRHSHVSLLIELGFSPVAISERVGHESIEVTLRYAHLFPTKQKEMADRLNMEAGCMGDAC